jgi:tetratricopeptide (TPR) repeat protein
MALIGVPLLLLGVLEVGLRLVGFGYPTSFLLKSSNRGEQTFVQNNQFGWRFFGPRASRLPYPVSIAREKPPGTVRIFVFGESAAFGDPQPRFGLPRMLQAMLELRHPGKKFEVVNASMTAINSHVILPLARDCADADADVWVIYMGNNEVVGPFGAGTVFGNQTLPLPLIRAGLALKATKTGQLFDTLRGAVEDASADSSEWEGLRAFVEYKLPASDPRLRSVYHNFEENLNDIIAAGRKSGARIVLSTVAVNLRDCAPFASLHRDGLSESRISDWQRLFDAGVKSQSDGDFQQAATFYDQAKQIDESFAELRFRRGECALALNDAGTAWEELAAARDLDALRFRCDSQLNEIIRRQGAGEIILADAERALAAASPDGISGPEFFYEHVHLTFEGNHVLTRDIAEKVESALRLTGNAPWPDIAACAQRLGHTRRDTQLALSDILGRLADVPYTFQAGHDEQMRRLGEASGRLPPADSAEALGEARAAIETALARWPDDAALWEQLGEIRQAQGDVSGALAAVQRSLDKVPSSAACWLLRGILLGQEEKYRDAAAVFEHVLALDPQAVWAAHNLALCLERLGRRDEAIVEFKHAVALKPEYGTAWLALGQLYEQMGRTNDAQQCYNTALNNRVNQADDLIGLARFCFSRRWFEPAATNYAAAIELRPMDPVLRLEAGRAFSSLGQHDDAVRQYLKAIEMAPDQVQPHMQLGVELGRHGKPAIAEKEFREVLRIDPEMIEARVNLGIALYQQEKFDDALEQFMQVLQRNPNDPNALRYVEQVRNRTPVPAGQ